MNWLNDLLKKTQFSAHCCAEWEKLKEGYGRIYIIFEGKLQPYISSVPLKGMGNNLLVVANSIRFASENNMVVIIAKPIATNGGIQRYLCEEIEKIENESDNNKVEWYKTAREVLIFKKMVNAEEEKAEAPDESTDLPRAINF